MLQLRNITRRFNRMRKTSSRSGSMEVCTNVPSVGSDVDTRFNTGRYNRFDKRRRQNRLGQGLWDSETGRRTTYGKRFFEEKNKRFNKKSDRYKQGKHENPRAQVKRNQEEQQQQGNGKSIFRQYLCKLRRQYLNRRKHFITNTRQLYYLQHKYFKSIFIRVNENALNRNRIQRVKNELWFRLRQAKRKRNIRKTGYKRLSIVRKSITNKKGRDRQTNKKC